MLHCRTKRLTISERCTKSVLGDKVLKKEFQQPALLIGERFADWALAAYFILDEDGFTVA
jgi:hypothetical protein